MGKQIKIALIGPLRTVGGVASVNRTILQRPGKLAQFDIIGIDTGRGDVKVDHAKLNLSNLLALLVHLGRFLKEVLWRRPNIIHVPVTSHWAFYKAALFINIAKALRLRVVAHLHGGKFYHYFKDSHLMQQKLIRWSMRQADCLLVLSNYWYKFAIQELQLPPGQVHILPNTVEPKFLQELANLKKSCPQSRLSILKDKKRTLLFVGRIGEMKGIFPLLSALARLRSFSNVRLILAGAEERPGELALVREHIAKLKMRDTVEFAGVVGGRAKAKLFWESDIFVFPSYFENLPVSVLEAMAAGLPIISTTVGGIPDIIYDGINGYLVPPGDVDALTDRLKLLISDPELCRRIGEYNRKDFEARFSPEIVSNLLAEIYVLVAKGGGLLKGGE